MRRSPLGPAGAAVPAVLVLTVLTGCVLTGCGHGDVAKTAATASAAHSPRPPTTGQKCGRAKTAAGVPILIEVAHGPVGCSSALKVERNYAHAMAAGRAPGNGGGGPLTVGGWTCEGYDTPEILKTGDTSKCTKAPSEILAVLPAPSPSPSS